jgi:hypothetical protein
VLVGRGAAPRKISVGNGEGRVVKIKVKPSRLLSQLSSHGFATGPTLPAQDSFTFVRQASRPALFEWIVVEASGKKSEAVYASVATGLTRWMVGRSLAEEALLMELAENQERGWSIIKTDAAARDWESRLVSAALPNLERITLERGVPLLERTEQLRRAVSAYTARLDLTKPMPDLAGALNQHADPKLLGVAQRAAWDVGLDEDTYGLAWLCIISYEKVVEEQPTSFFRQNPYTNPELLSRLHLVADWIVSSRSSN